MGLPMYVSPSLSKRQLPPKQPTSPPYTPPQNEDDFEEAYQNSRTSAFDIPEPRFVPQPEPPQRGQRQRSTSLPYSIVQQHIQRLHQQLHLHRTREQSSNLASRRGLHSAHLLNLNRTQQHLLQQQQAALTRLQDRHNSELAFATTRNIRDERLDDSQDEIDFTFDEFVSSLNNNSNSSRSNSSSNNNNHNSNSRSNIGGVQRNNNNSQIHNNNDHHSSSAALDNVVRRVNLLRQHHDGSRVMRSSSSRHHRSIGHSSSGRSSSRTSSQTVNIERGNVTQRGIDIPSSSSVSQFSEPTLLYPNEHNVSVPRISWHPIRRGVNWSIGSQPPPIQRPERRSSFVDDFYSTTEIHPYEEELHLSRILSPIPRRYDTRFAATLASLPSNGNERELLETNGVNNRSNVDRNLNGNDSIEPVRTEQRGSASGEVC